MQTPSTIETLQRCEFFKHMQPEDIEQISAICRKTDLNEGDYLFQQGDLGEHLYVIVDGQILLERSMDIGVRQGKVVIETLGKGRVLGCWSTLLGGVHILMSSALCRSKAQVLTLNGNDLRKMMESDTNLGFSLLERLCHLLKDRIQAAYGALEKI